MQTKIICAGTFLSLFLSCSVDPVVKDELPADDIGLVVPEDWPVPLNQFLQDPLTKDKFILGRRLFYEVRLSSSDRVSCGSCHQHSAAFSDEGDAFSPGVNAVPGTRNSPALFNLNWHSSFMWDGKFTYLHEQPKAPITNPQEMNETMERVLFKMNHDVDYRRLFKKAYGTELITEQHLSKALSQFMGMLVSYNSTYDRYMRGEISLNADELSGLGLFQANCAGCHPPPLFTDHQFRNNGLDSTFSDPGRSGISLNAADSGKFKVPSLRNISLTYPYMHDGRFTSLQQVLDHYTNGIRNSATLDTALSGGIILTVQEKNEIIAFLKTLRDEKFIRDKRFYDPFTN